MNKHSALEFGWLTIKEPIFFKVAFKCNLYHFFDFTKYFILILERIKK